MCSIKNPICLCLLIHTSAFCAIFHTHFKYMTRDAELHLPLTPWKIRFFIRGKCLFSLNTVITFFPPKVTKLIWESFTWMFLFAKIERELGGGNKWGQGGSFFLHFYFGIKGWISWKMLRYRVWQRLKITQKNNSNYTCMLILGEHFPPQGRGWCMG